MRHRRIYVSSFASFRCWDF